MEEPLKPSLNESDMSIITPDNASDSNRYQTLSQQHFNSRDTFDEKQHVNEHKNKEIPSPAIEPDSILQASNSDDHYAQLSEAPQSPVGDENEDDHHTPTIASPIKVQANLMEYDVPIHGSSPDVWQAK